MAPFTRAQASAKGQHSYHEVDRQSDTSPFVTISMTDQTETTESSPNILSEDTNRTAEDATKNAPYTIRIQSNRFHDDNSAYSSHEIKKLIRRDLFNRVTEVGENLAGIMFPDTAFGFPINDQFVRTSMDRSYPTSGPWTWLISMTRSIPQHFSTE